MPHKLNSWKSCVAFGRRPASHCPNAIAGTILNLGAPKNLTAGDRAHQVSIMFVVTEAEAAAIRESEWADLFRDDTEKVGPACFVRESKPLWGTLCSIAWLTHFVRALRVSPAWPACDRTLPAASAREPATDWRGASVRWPLGMIVL
jgi:hypothetical protein